MTSESLSDSDIYQGSVVHMRVSSATQTDEIPVAAPVQSPSVVILDADLGSSSLVKPTITSQELDEGIAGEVETFKQDFATQTEEIQDDSAIYDHTNFEIEVKRLMEHHEVECVRMQDNINFWKEKADCHIKQHKEMLENKTKLHMQLEERDLAHQQAQGQIKKLNSEIEILQRKINQQRFIAPYLTKSFELREAQKNNINGQNGDGFSASKIAKTWTHPQSNSPNKLI